MKSSKIISSLLLAFGVLLLTKSAVASEYKYIGELKIINKSNANFTVIGVHGYGVVINGKPILRSNTKLTLNFGDKGAKGEVKYIDDKHHEVISLDYNYTRLGSIAKVTGGKKYYQYTALCTLYGNKIIIENKQPNS